MPSWPEWVVSRIGLVKDECQPSVTDGKWRTMPTLPSHLMLSQTERTEIERAIGELTELCDQTPERDPRCEAETLVLITKMMLALPSSQQNELGAEATGEAFQVALEDLPTWAVDAAMRKWYRGQCGLNQHGQPYDYRWRPAPADLRRVAFSARYAVFAQVRALQRLLDAEPLREFSEEQTAAMRERLANLSAKGGLTL
ncbi:hypothetical protein [Bradyrhizobium zhanjiangense]|uniref:Uncharacterized protein n=1 Tax=Bradyrhizobium zhanjiangense TaxID=1325107 RepID=A0A4Q0S829_9BRAD|nr:hypothetical protein [Bradyrhizobium zhanjiangense]RXH31997.1 hypothetical protein XH94_32550 [Bradyrhizobium zhanjiangense]